MRNTLHRTMRNTWHQKMHAMSVRLGLSCSMLALVAVTAVAKPPIRADFFGVYPSAAGTQLEIDKRTVPPAAEARLDLEIDRSA